jgi:predicted nucleotidyltransferase
MAPDSVLNTAKRFIDTVRKDGIPVEAAYPFGSWVQGRASKWSDIDLAVISSAFKGSKFSDRRKLYRAILEIDAGIEPHPYRPEDFNDSNPFVREILRTGVKIV